jgi:hypothetical protein
LDKTFYAYNETVVMSVKLYDANLTPLKNTPFELDLLVNQQFIESDEYYTSSNGEYVRNFQVNSPLPSGNYQYIAYIAKSQDSDCETVGDTTHAFVYVDALGESLDQFNPYSLSFAALLQNKTIPSCGNSKIDPGESCEGGSICRMSSGCSNLTRTYDIPEACSRCSCPRDITGSADDGAYCSNCNSCGDGAINCNEECENGITERGISCRLGNLYVQRDGCSNCSFVDDGIINDELVDTCECTCAQDPISQCSNGNFIDYPESYLSGCAGNACNPCGCQDRYAKDSDNDGVEDKCDKEECTNKKDDDDDGLIDLDDADCSLCHYCGYGLGNACDRNECQGLLQGCFFTNSFFNYGSCNACSSKSTCESYGKDSLSCAHDACNLSSCIWGKIGCCTDTDADGVCRSYDNCEKIPNPQQEDKDSDGKGDACDLCPSEPKLSMPTQERETICSDGIDNDCDGSTDCLDQDCAGILGCCKETSDCEKKECSIENCFNNK